MKTKFLATFILLTTLFVSSCKDEKSTDNPALAAKEEKGFKVTLNVTVKKDDNFSLFYTEDGSTDFTKIQPIWANVKGSENPQDVVFVLPEDAIPTQLRLDFGLNKDQETILINKFSMNYLGKSFEAPDEKFFIYFDPDLSNTLFDKNKRTIDGLVKDGKRLYPSFYPNTKPLGEEINKLVK